VNGSTNYILTKIFENNESYKNALVEAQRQGFAESNPTLDTGGFDAKYKLIILNAHAFGLVSKPNEILNVGIDKLGDIELNYAREKGYKIKLIAQSYKTKNGKIVSFVAPKFISKENLLFSVDDVFNGVLTKTCFADKQFFVGKGAGAHPTASAVVSDISALGYDYRYEYKKINSTDQLLEQSEFYFKLLLRYETGKSSLCKNYFETIEESYENNQNAYLIGNISLEKLSLLLEDKINDYSFVLFESSVNEKSNVVEEHIELELVSH
jgi:homoserine dehydrogenase